MLEDLILPKNGQVRFAFFAGKGGVGKSTLSAATAVWLADAGYRALLVSTDLQRSLDDIFEQSIGNTPTPIAGVENLWALDTDVKQSIAEHQLKQIAVMENIMESMPELDYIKQHYTSSPCCETASWNRMTEFMNTTDYDVLVFDTAPGGHSLETILYPLKQAKSIYTMIEAKKITAGLSGKEADVTLLEQIVRESEQAMQLMQSDQTRYILLMHPRRLPLFESERMLEALDEYGFKVDALLINEILPADECERATPFFQTLRAQQEHYVRQAEKRFAHLTLDKILLSAREVIGLDALRTMSRALYGAAGGTVSGG